MAEQFHCSPFSFDNVDYFEFRYIFSKQQDVNEKRRREEELAASGRRSLTDLQ